MTVRRWSFQHQRVGDEEVVDPDGHFSRGLQFLALVCRQRWMGHPGRVCRDGRCSAEGGCRFLQIRLRCRRRMAPRFDRMQHRHGNTGGRNGHLERRKRRMMGWRGKERRRRKIRRRVGPTVQEMRRICWASQPIVSRRLLRWRLQRSNMGMVRRGRWPQRRLLAKSCCCRLRRRKTWVKSNGAGIVTRLHSRCIVYNVSDGKKKCIYICIYI